jgi:predicted dehydrogenase
MRRQRQFCPGPDFAVIFKMPSGALVGPIKREPSDRFIPGDDKQLKSMIEAVQARVKQARPVAVWPICEYTSSPYCVDQGGNLKMTKIRVGMVGCGFVSELHMYAFRRVYGVDVEVSAVAARGEQVVEFARRHQIPTAYRSFSDLIADREIDVIDICTPPNLHAAMIVKAMQSGKHVICEKPFAGYFGREGDATPIGKQVPKALMYERVLEEMDKTAAAIKATGRLFMYAEDWIYAPAVTKIAEIIKATRDKILFMKGEESHSGSHAAHAAQWAMTGGGSLIRMGCHPLSAVLYLKQVEAKARDENIRVASVTCDVGKVTACLKPEERGFIKASPVDVEDWGALNVTFSDGTKATVFSGDMIMGGVRNVIETYTSGGSLFANITPNTHLVSYQTSEEKLANVYITEKVDRKTGWQYVCLEEEWTRGYLQEIQDFMECIAAGRQPLSDLALAYETIKVNYAGYWAAQEGRRVTL